MKFALLWNTYGKDIEWFKVSAKSFTKFASGWDYVKCIVPDRDRTLFAQTCREHKIFLDVFREWPDKGFNHHLALQCMGDLHFPPDADVIFHIDADCVFAAPTQPSEWMVGRKVTLLYEDFDRFLQTPLQPNEMVNFMGFTGTRTDINRGQYWWKFTSDWALGWDVKRETMQGMPIAHVREVYSKTRECIEAHHRIPFETYVRGCRNEFPQTFCEFNALGAVAQKFFPSRYHWHQVSSGGRPFRQKVIQSWSHGGFDRPFCEGKIRDGCQTPRELFQKLGLL